MMEHWEWSYASLTSPEDITRLHHLRLGYDTPTVMLSTKKLRSLVIHTIRKR